ncbi:MAG: SUF system NifU family Fe-S cluster assembly protein [Phycisphaerae bacterium]|jgi:nitrogen fixation NifU-like protein|nr:SUF system NifU family Fe-S cluster assembly protein [Phycisphaerae bacterium]MBT5408957.1 SUF system NifU family Fe-S cluster assembly protein [Phycisphaerae bacterium]MBT6164529.1 SUF system NifU family Fe-S cluster assembly protein [Phycisphaerae bacterium]MBT7657115.1 SUF system NifU family Fe-S cluster assembly protein [Phycisphaerae bacterium]|tara:strand:- start:5233 stop:5670 length:438 start_codon:yes stop_codon:yes gene_type:complete
MSDLRELYLEMVTDHAKNPRHRGKAEPCTHIGTGNNPLCGDKIVVTVSVNDGIIELVKFDGEGCAISTASADLMAEILVGKTPDEATSLFTGFHELVAGEGNVDVPKKLAVFSGVREFPMRVKCATLAWHTVLSALEQGNEVSTE